MLGSVVGNCFPLLLAVPERLSESCAWLASASCVSFVRFQSVGFNAPCVTDIITRYRRVRQYTLVKPSQTDKTT